MNAALDALATELYVTIDDVWLIDSTPVECGRSRETAKRSNLAGVAGYGYCASHSATSGACACTSSRHPRGCPSPTR
jgi:hypothetical protein